RSVVDLSSLRRGDPGYARRLELLDEEWAINLIRGAIYAAYNRDDVLIVGRGGQAVLADYPKAIHVRIVAPMADRVLRLQAASDLSTEQARERIEERDHASAEYLRTFYEVDVNDPTLYHLVLNTGRVSIEQCVDLIAAAV
ncbi:MAG: cytidylate kinase-like family protein, partial [Anaerolineae bacterium]|nr:cytidylate kinase-like family protein [Anaerolineae bacterium]